MIEPRDLRDMPLAQFAFPGPLRERLVGLILAGTKTATAGLLAEYIVDGDAVPRPGDLAVVIDSDGRGRDHRDHEVRAVHDQPRHRRVRPRRGRGLRRRDRLADRP
jgi:hypothetical protein